MRKNEISEKINRMNKQRENSSKTSYINDKNTESNSRNTAEVIQSENKLQTGSQPMENKTGNIFIITDSH